jgi:hypothetical protein
MNKFGAAIAASALIAGTSMVTLKPAFAWSLDFTMVNHTDQPIVRLWASPSSDDSWESPFRHVFVPDYGGSQRMTFSSGASGGACYYDIKFEFAKGITRTINRIYLCGINTISLRVNDDGDVVYTAA